MTLQGFRARKTEAKRGECRRMGGGNESPNRSTSPWAGASNHLPTPGIASPTKLTDPSQGSLDFHHCWTSVMIYVQVMLI